MRFIYRKDYKKYDKKLMERTKERLLLIESLGMEEVSIGQFGIPSLMSGLYIEMIWDYSDDDFNSYIEWVKILKKRKKK